MGGVGDETEISAGRFDLRGRDITKMDDKIKPIIDLALRMTPENVITAPGTAPEFDLAWPVIP